MIDIKNVKDFKSLWEYAKNSIYKNYGNKGAGEIITLLGAAGLISGGIAHVAMIIFSKNIPKEQKKFMLPQELADRIINIASFCIFTSLMCKVGAKMVSSGKWSTPAIRKFVKENTLADEVKMGDLSTNLGEFFKAKGKDIKKEFDKHYAYFKDGIEVAATTIGAVFASNLLAPIGRNQFASWEQKRLLKNEVKKDDKSNNVYLTNKLYSPSVNNGGGLKI